MDIGNVAAIWFRCFIDMMIPTDKRKRRKAVSIILATFSIFFLRLGPNQSINSSTFGKLPLLMAKLLPTQAVQIRRYPDNSSKKKGVHSKTYRPTTPIKTNTTRKDTKIVSPHLAIFALIKSRLCNNFLTNTSLNEGIKWSHWQVFIYLKLYVVESRIGVLLPPISREFSGRVFLPSSRSKGPDFLWETHSISPPGKVRVLTTL